MPVNAFNKYREAALVLQRSRETLVESLADDVIDHGDDLAGNSYVLNEFLETQGTRLHFLSLVLGQLEQAADLFDEARPAEVPAPPVASGVEPAATPKKRRSRAKKVSQEAAVEGATGGKD